MSIYEDDDKRATQVSLNLSKGSLQFAALLIK